jgi:hypothetical protein
MSPRHQHVRVILTAGVSEPFDEAHTKRVEADGTLRKPFEASVLLAAVRTLADAASQARAARLGAKPEAPPAAPVETAPLAPFIAVVDSEQVRAAVTVALDAAMGAMVEEITRRVLATLNRKKPDRQAPEPAAAPPRPGPPGCAPARSATGAGRAIRGTRTGAPSACSAAPGGRAARHPAASAHGIDSGPGHQPLRSLAALRRPRNSPAGGVVQGARPHHRRSTRLCPTTVSTSFPRLNCRKYTTPCSRR